MNPTLTVIVAVVGSVCGGGGAAWIAARSQREKVEADAADSATRAAATMLHELRDERTEMRRRISELETHHADNVAAIEELRAAENRCQERLRRAVEVMRAAGLPVPPDLA